MLVPFLIMMREGIEAALIVGIIAGYLRQTGRSQWMPLVWIGIATAVLLSLAVGIVLDLVSAEFPQRQQELFEALVGLVAVGILTSMVFWMRKAARSIKAQLQHSIDAALDGHDGTGMALIAMVFFAVAREGLESVFFLLATFQQDVGLAAPVGALAGIAVAVAVGIAIYWGGVRLNLKRFFRWTGLFILVVAAGLLAGSLRALHEAGLWNGLQETAFDLSHVLPIDGPVGSVLAGIFGYQDTPAVGEVAIYILFLLITLPLFLGGHRAPREARSNA
ncbi:MULTISPECIES: iron uptake transporter permease EfeU [Inquilinus]|uniref:High-affinity iron transporter n=1 Tax=Inquilinus ginsengisoli TaxID=363840 RepID=A0ABU1K0W8_9PROT|nr:iron uptake transporter permease EfeU [Inquilinus ginsengisoli]MDR6294519.1 high-affinity iron transporter [Inquilinus ginsengisoli]